MTDVARCQLCGEPMPEGEEMFNYHGASGPCPKPPLPAPETTESGDDHHIPGVRADQTMNVLATSVCLMINSFATEDKKAGQALFAMFVHQLSSFSDEPATMAGLLRCVADEMDRRAAEQSAAADT